MTESLRNLSTLIIYMKYSRYMPELHRRETWDELVTRNMDMHIKKFPSLEEEIRKAYVYVFEKKVLPSMRSLQFGGKAIELNPTRLYNCSFIKMDSPDAFGEIMFLLMCGCGVGYSVQKHHVRELPEIIKPKKSRRFLITDSVEGWADSVKVLVNSYMGVRKSSPEFDFSDIRPKGTLLKTSGGVAPGPEPLKTCLHRIQTLLDRKKDGEKLTTLEVHDINCFLADAVLSGGIRRSAMISLFSFDDEQMRTCKFQNWTDENPQRARANNSAVILRHEITEEEFKVFWNVVKNSGTGEPGIFFTNDSEIGCNPCAEISLKAFQFCNLVTINVTDLDSQDEFNSRAKVAAFIATLQATYTDFHYLRETWKETTEKDALIGVSLSGIASNKIFSLDIKQSAEIVKQENERISKILGIKKASRTTTVKPEGTSSLVLGCSSGIHAWHSPYYIRRIRINKIEPLYNYILKNNPEILEDDYFNPTMQAVISLPIEAPSGAVFRTEKALDLLTRVKTIYKKWIQGGHRKGHNNNNVSCTVSVKENEWDEVGKWMWENKDCYTAITVLPYDNKLYIQPPFEEITKEAYEKLSSQIKELDLSLLKEEVDTTAHIETVACGGGACEIR